MNYEDEPITKADLKDYEKEVLANLQERLSQLKTELQQLRGENPKFDETEATLKLCRENAKRKKISLKSYIQQSVIGDTYKKKLLNLCEDEPEPIQPTKNLATEDETIINEDGNVFKQTIKKTKQPDYEIDVRFSSVSRKRF